jgi:hypothetical protein
MPGPGPWLPGHASSDNKDEAGRQLDYDDALEFQGQNLSVYAQSLATGPIARFSADMPYSNHLFQDDLKKALDSTRDWKAC